MSGAMMDVWGETERESLRRGKAGRVYLARDLSVARFRTDGARNGGCVNTVLFILRIKRTGRKEGLSRIIFPDFSQCDAEKLRSLSHCGEAPPVGLCNPTGRTR